MDPYQTYLDMLAAMHDQDLSTAPSLALVLRRWSDNGGFCPHQFAPETIQASLADVLWQTAKIDRKCPPLVVCFSLTCAYCEAGEGIQTESEAVLQGWGRIQETDLMEANFLGVCPDCQREQDER